jgi:hemerythrin
MSLFVWNDSYSVKVKQFDSEHQKLFDIINELYEGMKAGRGKDALGPVIRQLITYTERHFSSEEAALRRANYEQLDQHIAQHRAFVARVKKFSQDFVSGASCLSVEVLDFLKDWLAQHIRGTDQQYSTTLNAQGVR